MDAGDILSLVPLNFVAGLACTLSFMDEAIEEEEAMTDPAQTVALDGIIDAAWEAYRLNLRVRTGSGVSYVAFKQAVAAALRHARRDAFEAAAKLIEDGVDVPYHLTPMERSVVEPGLGPQEKPE